MPTGFEKWQQTINAALSDASWDQYDRSIQQIVNEFNVHLAKTTGYRPLMWTFIKAMIWTETGGPSRPAWKTIPMQIGNPHDPGLLALLNGREGGELIIPQNYKNSLSALTAIASPEMNIVAGVGYLLMRAAHYGSVTETKGAVLTYAALPGDSFAKIAHTHESTVDVLRKLNPGVSVIHPKQLLKIQKASSEKTIAGWEVITTTFIASKYNVGDANYAAKLDYCLKVIAKVSGRAQ